MNLQVVERVEFVLDIVRDLADRKFYAGDRQNQLIKPEQEFTEIGFGVDKCHRVHSVELLEHGLAEIGVGAVRVGFGSLDRLVEPVGDGFH